MCAATQTPAHSPCKTPLKHQHKHHQNPHNPLPHNGRVGHDERGAGEGVVDDDSGEVVDALNGGGGDDLAGAHAEDAAFAHGDDVRGVAGGVIEVVENGDERLYAPVEASKQVHELNLVGDVEVRCRLVKQQNRRVLRERHGHPHAGVLPKLPQWAMLVAVVTFYGGG